MLNNVTEYSPEPPAGDLENHNSQATCSPPEPAFHSAVEPWPDPVNGATLLVELARVLTRFLVLPPSAAETLALWVLHSYAFELRDVTTYIGIESPEKRCGKTTLLSVLVELVNRPVVAANISPPALFRVIEETHPTLVIDEADTFLQVKDELRGILNSGYSRKTAFVVRVTSEARAEMPPAGPLAPSHDRPSRLARFSCWCPKVMATIGRLPETLADRCIVIRMQRKLAREQCLRLRNLDASFLRRQCARFVLDQREKIASLAPEIPHQLNDREADIWEPLLVLADLAGGEWPGKARKAALAFATALDRTTPIGSLLLDIMVAFVEAGNIGKIHSRTLVQSLNCQSDRPWFERRKGRAVTELWLAQQLRPYGVRPRYLRIGETVLRGYVQEELQEVFQRYIPRADAEALRADLMQQAPEPAAPDSTSP